MNFTLNNIIITTFSITTFSNTFHNVSSHITSTFFLLVWFCRLASLELQRFRPCAEAALCLCVLRSQFAQGQPPQSSAQERQFAREVPDQSAAGSDHFDVRDPVSLRHLTDFSVLCHAVIIRYSKAFKFLKFTAMYSKLVLMQSC